MVFSLWLTLSVTLFSPGEETPPINIMELNDEIRSYLDEHVIPIKDLGQRVSTLSQVIFDKNFLNLAYNNDSTKTAVEVFESRSGNCLSFTAMFIGMSRYCGITARFQEVNNQASWDKKGNTLLFSLHINALISINNGNYVIDFNKYSNNKKDRVSVLIPDERATAHYYNNLGAELFAASKVEEAIVYFQKAVKIHGKLGYAWANLGVAYKAQDRLGESEEALLRAVDLNKRDLSAKTNLGKLYVKMGREKEAQKIFGQVESFRKKNPYFLFHSGQEAYDRGDFDKALKLLKTAVRRNREEHEFHFALARTFLKLGEPDKAARSLEKACALAPEETRNRYRGTWQKLQGG